MLGSSSSSFLNLFPLVLPPPLVALRFFSCAGLEGAGGLEDSAPPAAASRGSYPRLPPMKPAALRAVWKLRMWSAAW